ncbi:MAG: hypothetical protein ACM3VY_00120 [Candidatus Bathyarchaeota archaeon]
MKVEHLEAAARLFIQSVETREIIGRLEQMFPELAGGEAHEACFRAITSLSLAQAGYTEGFSLEAIREDMRKQAPGLTDDDVNLGLRLGYPLAIFRSFMFILCDDHRPAASITLH